MKNISKTLDGNKTTVMIRTMTEAIKGKGRQKARGSKKEKKNLPEKKNKGSERNLKCDITGIKRKGFP